MPDLQQLTAHVFVVKLMNATRTNIYLVRGAKDDGDTLIDPGPVGTAPVLLALDRRSELRLLRIALTHAHPAHAGSAARVARGTGVSVHVHAADAPFLDGKREPLLPRGRRGQLMNALGLLLDLCPPVYRLEPLPLDEPLAGLTVIATPGHTPGHVCLLHREDGVLFSGDALLVENGSPALPPPSLRRSPQELVEGDAAQAARLERVEQCRQGGDGDRRARAALDAVVQHQDRPGARRGDQARRRLRGRGARATVARGRGPANQRQTDALGGGDHARREQPDRRAKPARRRPRSREHRLGAAQILGETRNRHQRGHVRVGVRMIAERVAAPHDLGGQRRSGRGARPDDEEGAAVAARLQ
jgi:glyoxylase-like metal-dependent hydrolase (beta-lactamase superfamily II)